MIFFGDAASDSGNFGFSEACPLGLSILRDLGMADSRDHSPSCPDRVYVHSLSNINNQLNIGIVVIISSSWNLYTSESVPNAKGYYPHCLKHLPEIAHTSTY